MTTTELFSHEALNKKHLDALGNKTGLVKDSYALTLEQDVEVSDEDFQKALKCLVLRLIYVAETCDLPFSEKYPGIHKILAETIPKYVEWSGSRIKVLEKEVKELKERLDGKAASN
jgi:hypothetical protein